MPRRCDIADEQALTSVELGHRVDVFNVEVGDGPRTLGDDDDVSNADPMRRHVVPHEPLACAGPTAIGITTP
jgi:hypothetical protein